MSKLNAARVMCWTATLLFVTVAVDLLVGAGPVGLAHGLAASFGAALLAVSAAFDAGRSALHVLSPERSQRWRKKSTPPR